MNEAAGEPTIRQVLLTLAILLLMFLIGTVVASTYLARGQTAALPTGAPIAATATAQPGSQGQASQPQVTPTIALATPWGVIGLGGSSGGAVPTGASLATPLPDLPPIGLLGPPPESLYKLGDPVTFYWDWPENLQDTNRFSVYLQGEQGAVWLGEADAENLGTLQQLGITPASVGVQSGAYLWYVVVEDETGVVLARSEQRPIVFIADEN